MRGPTSRGVRGLVVGTTLLVVTGGVRAQEYNFTHYTPARGMPSSRVLSLAQDAAGYLWFGTDSGIARYDGTEIRSLPPAPAVPGSQIVALAAVGDIVVYATAESGLGAIDAHGSRPVVGPGLGGRVHAIVHDPQGGLLLATAGGVVGLRGESSQPAAAPDAVPEGCCTTVARDRRGRIWAGGASGLYQVRDGRYVRFNDDLPTGAAVNVVLDDTGGRLWVGTSRGLYRQSGDRFIAVSEAGRLPVISGAVAGDEVWFGNSAGALRVTGDDVRRIPPASGLGDGPVNDILVDREGSVWFATDGGAAKWVGSRFVTFTRAHGLPDDFVVALEGADSKVWAAGRSGVVTVDGRGRVTSELEVSDGAAIQVTALAVDGERLYVGTDRGLLVRDARGADPRFVSGGPVRALLLRTDGLWVGGGDGLRRLTGTRLEPAGLGAELEGASPVDLAEDSGGRLWVVDDAGRLWAERAGRLEVLALSVDGVDASTVDVTSAGDGVWAATRGSGAWQLLPDGSVSRLTRAGNGLASDFVRAVLPGAADELWLCTNRGLDRWHPAQGMTHFDLGDGIASLTCNPGAATLGPGGAPWFGTPNGLTVELESRSAPPPLAPPVVIREITAGGVPIANDSPILVTAQRNDVTISFSALSFRDEASTRFQYRLLGKSDAWSRPTDERRVGYLDLPPGDYTFEVQAISEIGLWSREPARVQVVVLPEIWQTTWFKAGGALLVLLGIGMVFRRRLRQVEDERRRLRGMVDKRTRELVEKNALLERMATTDELTGLPNRRFFLDTMERELRKLTRISTDQQLSVLVIDLDRFKSVNDQYGHAAGDMVLRQIAGRLAQGVRATDLPARYGGEEFAILLPDTGADGARFLAEKIRAEVEAAEVRYEGRSIHCTISVGVATIDAPRRYDSAIETDILRRADEAMYEAKTGGRNRVVVAPAAATGPE